MATAICVKAGAKFSLVIPGDLPLVQGWELQKLFSAAHAIGKGAHHVEGEGEGQGQGETNDEDEDEDDGEGDGAILVPAHDHRGTNAVWRKPADLFPLQFGDDSFAPHCAAAEATGKPCVILELAGIGLDVDSPADLRRLLASSGDTHAQRLARAWGMEKALAAWREPVKDVHGGN